MGIGNRVAAAVRAGLRALREEDPGALSHLRAARALLVDVRRCVALSEALAVAAEERLGQLAPEIAKWEARGRRCPPDVSERVGDVLGRLRLDASDAATVLRDANASIRDGRERLERCALELVRLRQIAAAYGADVRGLDLAIDEVAIRADAARSVASLLNPVAYREDEERDFLEQLFSELEREGRIWSGRARIEA